MFRATVSMLFLSLGILSSGCALLDSQKARPDYESYVWSRLEEGSIVSRGTNLVNVRWLELNSEYFGERQEVLGFADSLTREHLTTKKNFLLVALQMKPGAQYTKNDFKVFWHSQELSAYREIISVLELRSLYPFAYPFHRVFLYEIPTTNEGELKSTGTRFSIWTPWGKLDQEQS